MENEEKQAITKLPDQIRLPRYFGTDQEAQQEFLNLEQDIQACSQEFFIGYEEEEAFLSYKQEVDIEKEDVINCLYCCLDQINPNSEKKQGLIMYYNLGGHILKDYRNISKEAANSFDTIYGNRIVEFLKNREKNNSIKQAGRQKTL